MLHRHPGHAEAVARIAWCVDEAAIGAITGEVGSGKTVADASRAAPSSTHHATPSSTRQPRHRRPRPLHQPSSPASAASPPLPPLPLIPQAADALAAEAAERGKRVVIVVDEAHLSRRPTRRTPPAHQRRHGLRSPFALVLVGQPTLRARLRLGAFAASTNASRSATRCPP